MFVYICVQMCVFKRVERVGGRKGEGERERERERAREEEEGREERETKIRENVYYLLLTTRVFYFSISSQFPSRYVSQHFC